MDQLVRLDNQSEGRSFFHLDGLRSTVSLTTDAGSARQSIFYDAWGNERDRIGASASKFTFTGHEKDDETGLIYAKARFYDSDVGRFLSEDDFLGEVDSPPSLHRYAYALNNPLVFIDPSGFFAQQLAELATKEKERQATVEATKEIVGSGLGGQLAAVDPDAVPQEVDRGPQHMRSLEEQRKLAAEALENPDASATTVTEDDGLLSTGIPALDAELKRRKDFEKARQTIGRTGTAVGETALPLLAGTADDATVLLTGKDLNEKESSRLVAGFGVFLPFISGSELRLLKKGGDELLEATRPLLKQPPHRVVNALKDFQPRKFQFGDRTFLIDKSGMKHILERHHPEYWNGTLRSQQTFLDPSLEVDEVADIAENVLQQNRSRLIERGNVGAYPVVGEVGGVKYQVGINNGRIAQMFPIPN
jgi:RHS repeat-associated protein